MGKGFKLSVIMPVFNEKNTILKVIKKIKNIKINKEIIIVDDFSDDGTRELLSKIKDKDVKVFYHDRNYGKGHSLRTGIKHITGDIVIIQDADMEYNPKDYKKLVKPIIEGKSKVVYGTRYPKNKRESYKKSKYYRGTWLLTVLANLLYNAGITDEATCYKVFDSDVLKEIDLKCERFEFCPEVTAKVRKKGYKIIEVPISYNPRDFDEGKKIRTRDGIEAIWTLLKYRFVN